MTLDWNFWRVEGFKLKKPSVEGRGGMDIFWNNTNFIDQPCANVL